MTSKFLPLAITAAAPLLAISGAHAQETSGSQPPSQQAPTQQTPTQQAPTQQAPGPQATGQQTTSTCQFTSGSRNGSTVDFSATPGVSAVPVGSRCGDMTGSNGVAVAQQTGRMPGQGRFYRTPEAPVGMDQSGQPTAGYTLSCRYTSGPNAGSTHDFSGQLGATPIRIGSRCSDGQNKGVGVAAGGAQQGR